MAEDSKQSTGESDPQSEGFTFVDKRRVTDTPEPEVPQTDLDESEPFIENEAGDAVAPDSTHQIALYALGLLQMNAFQQLGLISDPATGKANRDLGQARVAIDCVSALAAILDGPDSALEPKLRQDVRRVLTDLRLNYVTQTKMAEGEVT